MFVEQSALGKYTDMARWPIFRTAKVTAMYPESNSADVVFLDGTESYQLPILGGLTASVFGLSYTVQPQDTLGQSIPPTEIFPEGAAPGTLPPCTVDIYCVVASFYGPRIVTGGYFIVGFIQPPLSEMKFPAKEDTELAEAFDKMLVFRHASDVQITIDKNGTTSIQHPSGARITMGYENAIDSSNPITKAVDLTQKDVNQWYHFCSNTSNPTGMVVTDSSGNKIVLNGTDTITVEDKAGDIITLDNGQISITDNSGDNITFQGGQVNITSSGSISQTTNSASLNAQETSITGLTYNQTAELLCNISGVIAVNITSVGVINITAPTINLNGNVNFGGGLDV